MTDREMLRETLAGIGASNTSHSGRKLVDHLLNTYDMLVAAGCPRDVCLAGGLHSIYGTNAFRHVSTEDRLPVRERFGEAAEHLAHLFCTINRPRGLNDNQPISWRTGAKVSLDDETLHKLRMIEAANLIEQGESVSRFPRIMDAWNGAMQCH